MVRDSLWVRVFLDLPASCSLGLSKTVKIASLDKIIKHQLFRRLYKKSQHPRKQGESHFFVESSMVENGYRYSMIMGRTKLIRILLN